MPRKLTPSQQSAAHIQTLIKYFETATLEMAEIAFALIDRVMKDRRAKVGIRAGVRTAQRKVGDRSQPAPQMAPQTRQAVPGATSATRPASPPPTARPVIPQSGTPEWEANIDKEAGLAPSTAAGKKNKRDWASPARRQAEAARAKANRQKAAEKARAAKQAGKQATKATKLGGEPAGDTVTHAEYLGETVPEVLPPQPAREDVPDIEDEIGETIPVVW